MSSTVTTSSVIEAIDAEREHWEGLLSQVGEERMEQPGVMGEWTFKDLVAHLTSWRQRSLDRLEAASRAQPDPAQPVEPDTDTEERMNNEFYEANRDRPLGDVLEDSRQTFIRLRQIVSAFSDDELNDPDRIAWLDGESLGHAIVNGSYFSHLHKDHEPDIRAFIASNG